MRQGPKVKPLDDRQILTSTYVRAVQNIPPDYADAIVIEQPQVSEEIGSYEDEEENKRRRRR
jgi:hypothetical protein